MKEFSVSVRKLTDEDLMREACECTFLGKSHQSLLSIYKSEHSPVRTQMFWIKLDCIPLFIATHLLRHHVGSVPFQLTCRDDRDGGNPGLIGKIDAINEKLAMLLSMINSSSYGTQEDLIRSIISELDWLKNNADRYTPVNLGLCLNAQALIDMSKLRLCTGTAHHETVMVFRAIKAEISKIDPDLAQMMVRKCVYRNGLCGEPRCCGFNHTPTFNIESSEYLSNFTQKQRGHDNRTVAQ